MTHRREVRLAGNTFFLSDIFKKEVAYVFVRADAEHRAEPLRKMADVMIMLLHPFAEQALVELPADPGLAPGMAARMTRRDRRLTLIAEFALRPRSSFLNSIDPVHCIQNWRASRTARRSDSCRAREYHALEASRTDPTSER